MSVRMTTEMCKRGFKNAAICSVGVVAVLVPATLAVEVNSTLPRLMAMIVASSFLWVVCIFFVLLLWVIGRNTAGSVLLDCGPHPGRGILLVCAGLLVILGCGYAFVSAVAGPGVLGWAPPLFLGAAAVWNAILGLSRLQMREGGIWQYIGLLKWDKIQTYEWKGDSDCTLMVQVKTWIPFWGRGALPVPVEQKDAVDDLLREHYSIDT